MFVDVVFIDGRAGRVVEAHKVVDFTGSYRALKLFAANAVANREQITAAAADVVGTRCGL